MDPDNGRRPFSPLLHLVLPEMALGVVITLRAPWLAKLVASFSLIAWVVYTLVSTDTGKAVDNYAVGSAVLGNTLFNTILFLCFTDPITELRHLRTPEPALSERSFLARFWNALCLVRNNRLIGWNAQVPNVPPATTSKALFFRRRVLQLLSSAFLVDLTESFVYPYRHFYDDPPPPGLAGYVLRSGTTFVWLVMTYAILKMFYNIASILAVALYLSEPQDWPDTFGSWKDAYTLRRLWGRTWHQNLRRHFHAWGARAIRVLGIPRGTFLSSQVQLHTAFAVSAPLHSCGDLMLGVHHFGRSLPFFAANAVAIAVEDVCTRVFGAALGGGPRTRTRRAWRVVGYVWVAAFMSVAGPPYVQWHFESGVVAEPVLPVSPLQRFVFPFL
ncbi:membrane bound O-acyl transferase family-domain-containing protein [Epithele typhae]|uniref:membrane bound O-acyl transferase family-domain-containing protein n=1 Tax=Epithele typhae TaxID=378194 RepID=UPI002007A5D5|nr:membrane bound O-acyl transferase family-domain-containing protein [Epithele typhae]KAH9937777.1 membrane bound O-acyl transferase family-domain-containing protein [Epithele typhae]